MPVAIALGSNLGDRERLLESAVAAVEQLIDGLRVSSWYQTAPVGVTGTQADFLNGAAVGTSVLSARALLDRLLLRFIDAHQRIA